MAQGRTEDSTNKLITLIDMLYASLRELGAQVGLSESTQDLVQIPPSCPRSPIFSLLTPKPRELAQYCQNAGYVVRAIVAPTVPEGSDRVRVCLHSGNTFGQVEGFVRILRKWIDQEKQNKHEVLHMPIARL